MRDISFAERAMPLEFVLHLLCGGGGRTLKKINMILGLLYPKQQ